MNTKKKMQIFSAVFALPLLAIYLYPTISTAAGPTVTVGTTKSFAVLAHTTVTNTGATTISGTAGGDLGLSPGTSYTGGTLVTLSGTAHITDAAAATAKTDLTAAISSANSPAATTLSAADLAGQTITPGVYTTASGVFTNSGNVILDAQGDSTAVFIFKTASTLITATGSTMTMTGSAQACNIFWSVGSSATLGTTSTFAGHIFAAVSITANTGATVKGSLLASTGAVTLDTNTITNDACVTSTGTTGATGATGATGSATLHVIKHVINDGGGTAKAADFQIHVKLNGVEVSGSPAVGLEGVGRPYSLAPGTYTVSEDQKSDYQATFLSNGVGTSVATLTNGQDKTITITNNDINRGTLVVVKHVINDGGGTGKAGDFQIHVKLNGKEVAASPAIGLEAPGRTYSLLPGNYVVSEIPDDGYKTSYSGTGITTGAVSIASDQSRTMTVTNNDINQATLHIVKQVVNKYTGTSVPGDFVMHVKLHGVDVAGSPAPGVGGAGRTYRLAPGSYAISEEAKVGYNGHFAGANLSNGFVTLTPDQDLTVVRINEDKFVATEATPTPPPTVTPTPTPKPKPTGTVTGGKLPKTGTPWNNLLALGAGLILAGAVGFTSRKVRK